MDRKELIDAQFDKLTISMISGCVLSSLASLPDDLAIWIFGSPESSLILVVVRPSRSASIGSEGDACDFHEDFVRFYCTILHTTSAVRNRTEKQT